MTQDQTTLRTMDHYDLRETLKTLLEVAYVEGKDAPYVVPHDMAGDQFKFSECKTKRSAMDQILSTSEKVAERYLPMSPSDQGGRSNPQERGKPETQPSSV